MDKKHHISVTGIIIKDGKFLITKRAPHKKAFPNMWTVPGGNLELEDYISLPKDTNSHWYNILEKVLKREIKEETELDVENIKYLTSMTFIRPDGEPGLIISLYADYKNGEVQLDADSIEYKWASLEEAKNYELIEGIYQELEMLDKILNGEKVGEWSKN